MDYAFCEQLEEVAGCKLPDSLKVKISELVSKHYCVFGLSVNLDLSSVATLPADMKMLIARMTNYATNLHDRTKDLVVQLMKAIVETKRIDSEYEDLLHHIQGRMGILLLNLLVLVPKIIQVYYGLIAPLFVSFHSINRISTNSIIINFITLANPPLQDATMINVMMLGRYILFPINLVYFSRVFNCMKSFFNTFHFCCRIQGPLLMFHQNLIIIKLLLQSQDMSVFSSTSCSINTYNFISIYSFLLFLRCRLLTKMLKMLLKSWLKMASSRIVNLFYSYKININIYLFF
jgi:hypothetical protein